MAVFACGLCGTGPHIPQGGLAPALPAIPGHEFADEVVAVGSRVTGLAVVTRVAVNTSMLCFTWDRCRRVQSYPEVIARFRA